MITGHLTKSPFFTLIVSGKGGKEKGRNGEEGREMYKCECESEF